MAKERTKKATKEEVEYLKECFDVVDGVLFWKSERPDSHFNNERQKRDFLARNASNPAGAWYGNDFRLMLRHGDKKLSRKVTWFVDAIEGKESVVRRMNAPAPANEEQKQFARECFTIKNGVLYWRKERPDHHFIKNAGRKIWVKNWAGKPAGRADGRGFRVSVSMDGKPFNRSVAWFYEAITGEKQPEPTVFNFSNLMSIMNDNLKSKAVETA